VCGQRNAPAATLSREGDKVPIVQEAGWAPGSIWTDVKILASFLILSPDRPVRSTLEAQTLIGILQRVKLAIQPGYLSSAINSSEYDSSFSRLLIRPI